MRMNYVPKHFRDHADSEYASYAGVVRKWAEFIGTKQTYRHSTLYISDRFYAKQYIHRQLYCKYRCQGRWR